MSGLPPRAVGEWFNPSPRGEMATKDRGSKKVKTAPSKNLKEKRKAKKEKRAATDKNARIV